MWPKKSKTFRFFFAEKHLAIFTPNWLITKTNKQIFIYLTWIIKRTEKKNNNNYISTLHINYTRYINNFYGYIFWNYYRYFFSYANLAKANNNDSVHQDPIQNAMGKFAKWQILVCASVFLLKFPVAWHQVIHEIKLINSQPHWLHNNAVCRFFFLYRWASFLLHPQWPYIVWIDQLKRARHHAQNMNTIKQHLPTR